MLIEFMYTGDLQLTSSTAPVLYTTACHLQIQHAVDLCQIYLLDNLTPTPISISQQQISSQSIALQPIAPKPIAPQPIASKSQPSALPLVSQKLKTSHSLPTNFTVQQLTSSPLKSRQLATSDIMQQLVQQPIVHSQVRQNP